jgi:hypothetical protein
MNFTSSSFKKSTFALGSAFAILASAATSADAASVLYVANSNNAAFQTFATSGSFVGNTWTHIASGTTGDTIGGDLDRTTTLGGISQTVKSYLESFDLIILSTPITSGNYVDGATGADWAGIAKPILSTAAFASRATGGRMGLVIGTDLSPFTFTATAETTVVSGSAVASAIFAGTTTPTDLLSAASGQTVAAATAAGILIGGGELISTYAGTAVATPVGVGIAFWTSGQTDTVGRTLASNRSLFALNGTFADLNADGQIVLGNLINQTIAPVPEPSTFAMLTGLVTIGLAASRRRRS